MIDAFGIHLGPLYIRFYALILIAGMALGALLTARRATTQGLDPKHVWDGLMWAIIPGLIGARVYHILTPSPDSGLTTEYYLRNPLQMLAIWNGGLGIYGGIVGGMIGLLIYGRRQKQPILRWFDLIVPALALGQGIGRWGNYINQELYGAPTTLPWAIYIRPENRLPGFQQYETFHPLFLYESIWNLGTCLFLLWIERRYRDRLRPGDLVLVYLMMYPTIRFLLDFVRLDSHMTGALTTAQLVSLVTFVAAATVLFVRHRLPARSAGRQGQELPAQK
jgi:phosphatidylglycerol:prolipoprotein diacylglycerol transferase